MPAKFVLRSAIGEPLMDSSGGCNALWCRVEAEAAAVALGELVLVVIARHVGFAAPVDDRGGRRAQSFGLGHRVDRRVAGADHDDLPPNRRVAIGMRLE